MFFGAGCGYELAADLMQRAVDTATSEFPPVRCIPPEKGNRIVFEHCQQQIFR